MPNINWVPITQINNEINSLNSTALIFWTVESGEPNKTPHHILKKILIKITLHKNKT